jgi:hypothetical protein
LSGKAHTITPSKDKVNSLHIFRVFPMFLVISVPAYFAWRIWRRRRNLATRDAEIDFRPSIGFTRMDGWASLALLMLNKSDSNVWAEEIEIVLADLIADDQTSEASCHGVQKIHQFIRPFDMLPVSLVETIYKAAGEPQRKYSCVISTIVRYRAGEQSFEMPMHPYRLRMAGLTVVSNRRERWTKSEFKPQNKSRNPQLAGTKSK